MRLIKLYLIVVFSTATPSAGAFTVPRTQKHIAPSSTQLLESVEDELLTEHELSQIRGLVDRLASLDNGKDLVKEIGDDDLNNRELDVAAFDKVVTPERTRNKVKPPSFVVNLIDKTLLSSISNTKEAPEKTRSIFKALSELLKDADQVFNGHEMTLGYEKYPNHPEVSRFCVCPLPCENRSI